MSHSALRISQPHRLCPLGGLTGQKWESLGFDGKKVTVSATQPLSAPRGLEGIQKVLPWGTRKMADLELLGLAWWYCDGQW